MSPFSHPWARRFYLVGSLHPPRHPLKAGIISYMIKGAPCMNVTPYFVKLLRDRTLRRAKNSWPWLLSIKQWNFVKGFWRKQITLPQTATIKPQNLLTDQMTDDCCSVPRFQMSGSCGLLRRWIPFLPAPQRLPEILHLHQRQTTSVQLRWGLRLQRRHWRLRWHRERHQLVSTTCI